MARPQKRGLDYFPLDVDIDQDDKIQLVEALHGMTGFSVVIKLLMRIYKEGYYYEWGEVEQLLFSRRVNVDINPLNDIVNDCIKYGIFDKKVHEEYKVLTSPGIQERYFEATKRRKNVTVVNQYMLINGLEKVNVNINRVDVDINGDIVNAVSTKTPQSKVKESKGKESKQEQTKKESDSAENESEKVPEQKSVVVADNDFSEALKFYQENLQIGVSSSPHNYELLGDLYDEFGLEVLIAAMKVSAKAEKRGIPYLDGILKRWREAGVKTIEDARKLEAYFQNNRQGGFNSYAQNVPVIPVYEEVKPIEKRDGKHSGPFGNVQLFK